MSTADGSCNAAEHEISRRRVLGTMTAGAAAGVAGGVASGALGIHGLMRPRVAEALAAKDRQVILIWLDGGISQLESWDPKPGSEFGGPFRSIPTTLPGVHVSELLPSTARRMHQLAVIRSMSTKDENHSSGVPRMLRGDPQERGVEYPYLGAAVTRLLGPRESGLPPYVWVKPGRGGFIWQHAGFLGSRYGALALGDGRPPVFVDPPKGLGDESARRREALRRLADRRFRRRRRGAEIDAYDSSFEMAEQLMRRKELFDESIVPPRDRERYGSHPLGRHLLQARRLVEAGVRFVQVTSYYWDTHADNFNMHRALVPQVDRPFAALIDDLEQRGLLDRVLVVLMSEFGRTPKINQRLGRDHWPEAWSLALAGAGIRRGVVIGKTTDDGVWVDDSPYDVGDLFHTIYRALGVDADETSFVNKGQPLPIAHESCSVIEEALA